MEIISQGKLWQAIVQAYERATREGVASAVETKEDIVDIGGGARVILRHAPALAKKPKGNNEEEGKLAPSRQDPFQDPDPRLLVGAVGPKHMLVLNKFNVVDHHVLIVTRGFEHQEDPLSKDDIEATLAVIDSMPHGGLAFYNCGSESGASQPHKHMQAVPLPLSQDTTNQHLPLEPLLSSGEEGVGEARNCPYVSFVAAVGQGESADSIHSKYERMLALSEQRVGRLTSYNFILTRHVALLVPRSKETSGSISANGMGELTGRLGFFCVSIAHGNGDGDDALLAGYAGSLLVKTENEKEEAKRKGPLNILAELSFSWDSH